MAFLQPVFLAESPYVLRALQPAEDRINLSRPRRSWPELEQVIATLGRIVAWGQLRSAGRNGSAIADELIDFGRRRKWKDQLLGASIACAAQVHRDATAFNAAWDDGAFSA